MLGFSDIFFLMVLGFSLAAPLGPVNMEMVKRALQSKFGFVLAVFTGLGAMTGDFLVASTVLYVGEEYLKDIIEIPVVYIILIIFNVFILGYIGLSALKAPPLENKEIQALNTVDDNIQKSGTANDETTVKFVETNSILKQIVIGFGIVITSPWSYFWWISFGGYIITSEIPLETNSERLIVTLFFLAGIFAWIILFCGLLGVSRQVASPKVLNYITKSSAAIILLFALKILYDGIAFLILLNI